MSSHSVHSYGFLLPAGDAEHLHFRHLQAALLGPYLLAYALAPAACHAGVAGLEAATVAALTAALADLDGGRLPAWRSAPVPAPAREYWRLPASHPRAPCLKARLRGSAASRAPAERPLAWRLSCARLRRGAPGVEVSSGAAETGEEGALI